MAFKQLPQKGPWHGIVKNAPIPLDDTQAFDDIANFFCRQGRMQSRPKLSNFGAPPDGHILRNMITFKDVINNVHTLALTTNTAYALSAGAVYNSLGSIAGAMPTSFPYGIAPINNRVYFANGSVKLQYADGTNALVDANANVSAYYMGVLNSHLVLVNTIEPPPGVTGSINYPQRIRWSVAGNPNDWTSFTSGFADNLDVSDSFTGFVVLGSYGYAFRPQGITIMSPTGQGASPFQIQQMSYSAKGVGNKYAYSLASYGNLCAFVANDDIYQMTIASEPQRIGTKAKQAIFKDLAKSSGDSVVGFFVSDFGPGYDFLSYWLSIPGANVTWIYHFDEGNWVRFTSSLGYITSIATVATS